MGQLEEREQAGALARAEAVAELLESPGESRRVAVALARLVGELLGLGAGGAGGGRRAPARARPSRGAPARGRPRRRRLGRPVRSIQRRPRSWCGVGSSKALFKAASPISSVASACSPSGTWSASGSSPFVSTTEVALSGVTATRAHLLEGLSRDELDRVDGALGGDAEARQQAQAVGVARVLDRGDRRQVELAGEQARVEVGRHALHLVDLGLEPVEDRRHVHIGDAAEADHDSRFTTA